MRINYFSDIHLEFGALAVPDTNADIIIVAGDIGIYNQGIEWLKIIDKPVIYVAGNHEYYTHEYHETLEMLIAECANTNIHFLENNTFIYEGVRFLGCTLWTDLFVEGEENTVVLECILNDFIKIRFADGRFNSTQFSDLYRYSRAWLETALATPFSGKTIVVTHHAPTQKSWPGSPDAVKKIAYCNDLASLIKKYNISAWFHGHTHSIADYRIGETRILSNTRGYVGRKVVAEFYLNRTVVI